MEAYSIHWHRLKNQDLRAHVLLPELDAAPAIDIGVAIPVICRNERDMRVQRQAGMPNALTLVAALRVPWLRP